MKNYFKFILKHWFSLLMITLTCFVASVFVIKIIDDNNAYYQASFEVSNIEEFDVELLNDVDFLNEVKASAYNAETNYNKYENINVEKLVNKQDLTYIVEGNKVTIKTSIKYYDEFFLKTSATVGTRAKTFIKDAVLKIAGEDIDVTFENEKDIVTLKNNIQNTYLIAAFVSITVLLIEFAVCVFIYNKKKKEDSNIVDNINVFSSIFHKEYWNKALKPLTKVKDITMIAMLFAMMLVCKLIPIPSGFGNLGLGLTYIFFSITCMIYGPIYGFVIGAFLDVLGYFMPNGGGAVFHLGYTLQTAITGMIYGLCFYRRKIGYFKVFLSRVLVNFLMNTIYGSFLYVWVVAGVKLNAPEFKELYGSYMVLLSLPKNIIYLIPQSLLLFLAIRAVIPILARFNYVPKEMIIRKQAK